jgi:hypothetical protein
VAVHESLTSNVQDIFRKGGFRISIVRNILVVFVIGIQLVVGGCYFVVRLVLILIGKEPGVVGRSVCLSGVDFSEDCLPPQGDIQGIGGTLKEFEVLGCPETKQAYFIRCPECVGIFNCPKDSHEKEWVKAWNEELAEAEEEWDVQFGGDAEGDMPAVGAAVTAGTAGTVGEKVKSEVVDLTSLKMEGSPSTMTTDPEGFDNGLSGIVGDLHVARNVIVID